MKKFIICSMMWLTALTIDAQVLTATAVCRTYENLISESGGKFSFNAERDDDGNIVTMYVYRNISNRKDVANLKPAFRHQYTYTADGTLSSRTKYAWRNNGWQCLDRYDYTLTDSTYTIEFCLWNRKKADFSLPAGKMVYLLHPDETLMSVAYYSRKDKYAPLLQVWELPMESRPVSLDYFLSIK